MNILSWIVLYLLLHLPALWLLYFLWIQHERGGWWKVFHLFGVIGFLPDVVANYTTLAILFWSWPGRAFTFSKHLKTLCLISGGRGRLANMIADILDDLAPSGNHIHREGVIQ